MSNIRVENKFQLSVTRINTFYSCNRYFTPRKICAALCNRLRVAMNAMEFNNPFTACTTFELCVFCRFCGFFTASTDKTRIIEMKVRLRSDAHPGDAPDHIRHVAAMTGSPGPERQSQAKRCAALASPSAWRLAHGRFR